MNAIQFEETSPNWQAEGAEPREELKEQGFQAGYRPPAAYFNWFWTRVSRCIQEIQNKLKAHGENKQNPHGVTAQQVNALSDKGGTVSGNVVSTGTVTAKGWGSSDTISLGGNSGYGITVDYRKVVAKGDEFRARNFSSDAYVPIKAKEIYANYGELGQVTIGGSSGYGFGARNGIAETRGDALNVLNFTRESYRPVNASAFHQSSARRFKKDIEDLQSTVIEKLLQLHPVQYVLNDESSDTRQKFGLIAEEVESVFPQMVSYSKEEETNTMQVMGLDYQMLFAPMLLLLQSQQQQIKELQNHVQALGSAD